MRDALEPMDKRRYDSKATRRELIAAGRALFAENGYAGANAESIVAAAGLTRGALYHHFDGKRGLFEAVLESMQAELADEISVQARRVKGGPLARLRVGFGVYLDMALRQDMRQVLLIDGPAVLGWTPWHEIDLKYGFRATEAALAQAMQAGEIDQCPVEQLTHVLLGAVTQAGLEIGRAPDPESARAAYGEAIDLVLDKLRRQG